MFMGACCHS